MALEDAARERWAGGTAIVTGAGSGIGRGMARAAAAMGMAVVLADIDGERVATVAAELTARGAKTVSVPTDVSDFSSVERLADVAFDEVGDVRLLANNAGVEQTSLLWDAPVTAWHRLMGVNLTGVYQGIRAFVPRLLDAGRPATIINTASVASFTSGAYQGMYQVSKRAVLALSESLASDLETVNAPIQVSVAFPSAVDTAIFQAVAEEGGEAALGVLQSLRDLLADQGMDADVAGVVILEAACSGRRWISTHPDDAAVFATLARDHLAEIASALHDESS